MADNRPDVNRVNRRRVLKTVGSAAAVSMVGSAQASSAPRVAVRMGTVNSPVTKQQTQQARNVAKMNYMDRGGRFGKEGPDPRPKYGSDQIPVVSYVFTVADDGTTHHYTGRAADPKTAAEKREKARTIANQFRNRNYRKHRDDSASNQSPVLGLIPKMGSGVFSSVGTEGVVASFNENIGSDWVFYDSGSSDAPRDPYGALNLSYDLYYLDNDGSSFYDYYAVKAFYETVPGTLKYGSDYETTQGAFRHLWDGSFVETSNQLEEYDPGSAGADETVPVTIGTSGVDFEYDYNQGDMSVSNTSDLSAERYSVYLDYGTGSLDTDKMEPGSQAQIQAPNSGSGSLRMLECTNDATFSDGVDSETIANDFIVNTKTY